MPFYRMPEDWNAPEKGVAYTKEEFDRRIASNVQAMNLAPGSLEETVIGNITFIELDKLFNNAPN